jgi:hypothetical protein
MRIGRHLTPAHRRTLPALRVVQFLAATALAIGIGGYMVSASAGALDHDPATTSTSTTTTAPAVSPSSSATPNPNTYDLSALANSLDVLVTDPNLPVSSLLTIEAGPYGASASLNSLGISESDAGAPYSPAVASLPGTVNGLGSGFLPPLPSLPGYVSANYPGTPSDNQTQGGYAITSSSSATDAKGAVAIGVQPAGSNNATLFASAETVANSDGSVDASASAGLDALSFGQLFDLANVSSSVSLNEQASSEPTVTSQTNLGTITLLGAATGLSSSGLNVLGLNVPIDINKEVIGTLNTLLASSGIKFTYLPETITYTDGTQSTGSTVDSSKTLESIDSGALRVTVSKNLGSQGNIVVSFTVGRTYVTTTDTPAFAPSTSDEGTGLDLGGIASSPSSVVPFDEGSSGVGSLPTVSSGVTGSTTPVTTTPAPSPHTLAVQPTYAIEKGPSAESLYLMLILVALAMLLGSQAVRVFAVRLAMSGHRGP